MTFSQVLQELNIPTPLETILDVWIKKMPLIGQPDKRKLLSKLILAISRFSLFTQVFRLFSGLALASLLTVPNDSIYQRFDVIIQCVCETLNDIMKEDPDDQQTLVE